MRKATLNKLKRVRDQIDSFYWMLTDLEDEINGQANECLDTAAGSRRKALYEEAEEVGDLVERFCHLRDHFDNVMPAA